MAIWVQISQSKHFFLNLKQISISRLYLLSVLFVLNKDNFDFYPYWGFYDCYFCRSMLFLGNKLPNTRVISLCTIVWCWNTPSLKACNVFNATHFRQSRSMAVTAWTLSWFGRPESKMEPSWSGLILSGMLGSCSYSPPRQQQTQAPSRSLGTSCRGLRHMTIRKMVIIWIKSIMYIIVIIRIILINKVIISKTIPCACFRRVGAQMEVQWRCTSICRFWWFYAFRFWWFYAIVIYCVYKCVLPDETSLRALLTLQAHT